MKKFISIIVLILVIIGLVIGLGYSWKLIINKDKEILTLTQENTDLKETVTTLNNTIENLQNNINDETEDEDNKKEEISFFFDESKVINKEENTKITQDIVDSMSVLSISVNVQDNSLTLNLDKELAKLIYGYNGEGESHTIAGFSQKIEDAQIAIAGANQKDLKVVLLMEDGAVKYIDIDSILDKSYTVKTIADSKDYVKLVKVTIKDEESANVKYGIAAMKKDGTCNIINF